MQGKLKERRSVQREGLGKEEEGIESVAGIVSAGVSGNTGAIATGQRRMIVSVVTGESDLLDLGEMRTRVSDHDMVRIGNGDTGPGHDPRMRTGKGDMDPAMTTTGATVGNEMCVLETRNASPGQEVIVLTGKWMIVVPEMRGGNESSGENETAGEKSTVTVVATAIITTPSCPHWLDCIFAAVMIMQCSSLQLPKLLPLLPDIPSQRFTRPPRCLALLKRLGLACHSRRIEISNPGNEVSLRFGNVESVVSQRSQYLVQRLFNGLYCNSLVAYLLPTLTSLPHPLDLASKPSHPLRLDLPDTPLTTHPCALLSTQTHTLPLGPPKQRRDDASSIAGCRGRWVVVESQAIFQLDCCIVGLLRRWVGR